MGFDVSGRDDGSTPMKGGPVSELRWHQDKTVSEQLNEVIPKMASAVQRAQASPHADALENAIRPLCEGELIGWVAVAVHRHPDGSTSVSVHGDPSKTALEHKGYLHSGVWAAAHTNA